MNAFSTVDSQIFSYI